MSDAQREAKYTTLYHSLNKLKVEIAKHEDLVAQLKGGNKACAEGKVSPAPIPTFQEVYDNLSSTLIECSDRLIKIREELKELLI